MPENEAKKEVTFEDSKAKVLKALNEHKISYAPEMQIKSTVKEMIRNAIVKNIDRYATNYTSLYQILSDARNLDFDFENIFRTNKDRAKTPEESTAEISEFINKLQGFADKAPRTPRPGAQAFHSLADSELSEVIVAQYMQANEEGRQLYTKEIAAARITAEAEAAPARTAGRAARKAEWEARSAQTKAEWEARAAAKAGGAAAQLQAESPKHQSRPPLQSMASSSSDKPAASAAAAAAASSQPDDDFPVFGDEDEQAPTSSGPQHR